MRLLVACAALLAVAVGGAEAQGFITPASAPVSDATIISMCGGKMAKMFAQYGTPTQLWADRGATEEQDDVFLGYGAYGFKVRDNVVRVCFFFKGWMEPIRGIKIGDRYDDVARVFGNPRTTVKDKDGVVTAVGYDLKEPNANLFANFKEGKVWRVEVSLK
jgi:hypothetical protein